PALPGFSWAGLQPLRVLFRFFPRRFSGAVPFCPAARASAREESAFEPQAAERRSASLEEHVDHPWPRPLQCLQPPPKGSGSPALYNLAGNELLSREFAVIGVARAPLSTEDFRKKASADIRQFATGKVDPDIWEWFVRP